MNIAHEEAIEEGEKKGKREGVKQATKGMKVAGADMELTEDLLA